MCWCVYIATEERLPDAYLNQETPENRESPPTLSFREIDDEIYYANSYRPFFKGQFLYDVGSDTGCGCGLERRYTTSYTPEGPIVDYYSDESPLAFIAFIKEMSQKIPLEMYVVWEDDRMLEPRERVAIDARSLTIDNYFKLVSRQFYTFKYA
jgi:hypothetical protein